MARKTNDKITDIWGMLIAFFIILGIVLIYSCWLYWSINDKMVKTINKINMNIGKMSENIIGSNEEFFYEIKEIVNSCNISNANIIDIKKELEKELEKLTIPITALTSEIKKFNEIVAPFLEKIIYTKMSYTKLKI